MDFPTLPESLRIERLQLPQGKVRVVIDTDTYNEIDDQFAVVHALLSPEKLEVEALYAAPFFNRRSHSPGDGMERSYGEILRLLERLDVDGEGFAFRGSDGILNAEREPISNDATTDLIGRALESEAPLYVVAIGALTNIASAILIEPAIIEKIVVVWLGGNALHWPHTDEFNLCGDLQAARLLFDCGVPLVLVPCRGVTTHLRSTVAEIERYVQGQGAIGDYLADTFKGYSEDHFGWSKEIWDVAAVAYLLEPAWTPSYIVSSPIIAQRDGDEGGGRMPLTWSIDPGRHPIRYVQYVDRDPIFRDLFSKLAARAGLKEGPVRS